MPLAWAAAPPLGRPAAAAGVRAAIRGGGQYVKAGGSVQEAQVGGGGRALVRDGAAVDGTARPARCTLAKQHYRLPNHNMLIQLCHHAMLQVPSSPAPRARMPSGPAGVTPKSERSALKLPVRTRNPQPQQPTPQQQPQQSQQREQRQPDLAAAELAALVPAHVGPAHAALAAPLQAAPAGPTVTPPATSALQPSTSPFAAESSDGADLASGKRAEASAVRRVTAARKAAQDAARLAAERDAELQHIRIEQLRDKVVALQQQLHLLPAQMNTMAQASRVGGVFGHTLAGWAQAFGGSLRQNRLPGALEFGTRVCHRCLLHPHYHFPGCQRNAETAGGAGGGGGGTACREGGG